DQEPSSPGTHSGSTQHLGSGTRRSCPVRQSRLESISFPQFSFVVSGLTAPQGCPAGGLPNRDPMLSAPTIHNSLPVKTPCTGIRRQWFSSQLTTSGSSTRSGWFFCTPCSRHRSENSASSSPSERCSTSTDR